MDFDDICIICLETISNQDAIWNCSTCYCEYHLVCINDWISQYRNCREKLLTEEQDNLNLSEGYASALNRLNRLVSDVDHWSCPKCRNEYSNDEAPNKYLCYCGKIADPKLNHWLQPHSCGDQCGKFLKPYCGDICLELCHRGPCPPCPKMLNNVSCYCGNQSQSAIRCSQRFWSCEKPCGKLLACNIHVCDKVCHANCGPCESIVVKSCLCGENSKNVKCSETWQCSKSCKEVDESLLNKCPCGKMSLDQMNSGDGYKQMTCGDSCNKFLECGIHRCYDKCHLGDCSICRQMISKSCRCGATVAMILCHKNLTCKTKCVRWKNCNKHQCKRRCCDPNLGCSPCELICNNLLSCRKHRCQLRCHTGPCYPCQKVLDVSCPCGATAKRVACGINTDKIRTLLTKFCKNFCTIPSKCRHDNRHKCHSNDEECPPCKELCPTVLECKHQCQRTCHDSVKTTIRLDKSKLIGPWQAKEDGKIVFVSQPCPPCNVELSLICFGSHEVINYVCSQPLTYASCGRPCGRLLPCENHFCSLECHPVSDNKRPDQLLGEAVKTIKASSLCEESCNRTCSKTLQQNPCSHPCPKTTCHSGECPPCTRYVSYKCHCGALNMHIECHIGPNPPPEKLSCPSRCSRTLTKLCGHQCPRNCHPGNCGDVDLQCKTKVTKKCPCGERKMQIPCWKVKNFELKCDPTKCDFIIDCNTGLRRRKSSLNNNTSDGVDDIKKDSSRISKRNIAITFLTFISIICAVYLIYSVFS